MDFYQMLFTDDGKWNHSPSVYSKSNTFQTLKLSLIFFFFFSLSSICTNSTVRERKPCPQLNVSPYGCPFSHAVWQICLNCRRLFLSRVQCAAKHTKHRDLSSNEKIPLFSWRGEKKWLFKGAFFLQKVIFNDLKAAERKNAEEKRRVTETAANIHSWYFAYINIRGRIKN